MSNPAGVAMAPLLAIVAALLLGAGLLVGLGWDVLAGAPADPAPACWMPEDMP